MKKVSSNIKTKIKGDLKDISTFSVKIKLLLSDKWLGQNMQKKQKLLKRNKTQAKNLKEQFVSLKKSMKSLVKI